MTGVIEGSYDILTMALGTAEHSGHVRGIGFGVKPTTYFNLPRRGSRRYSEELENKYKEECSKRKEIERKFNDLQAQMKMHNEPLIAPSLGKVAFGKRKSNNQKYLTSTTKVRGSLGFRKSHSNNSKVMKK